MTKTCQNCQNRCMDMDMEPYCSEFDPPFGRYIRSLPPEKCGEGLPNWAEDQRPKLIQMGRSTLPFFEPTSAEPEPEKSNAMKEAEFLEANPAPIGPEDFRGL